MKPENLQSKLDHLNKVDLLLVSIYVFLLWLRHRAGSLRPRQVFFPAVLAQIITFIYIAFTSSNVIPAFAVGNLAIVAIAMLPSTIQRPRYHWVK